MLHSSLWRLENRSEKLHGEDWGGEEGWGGGAASATAKMPCQPVEKTMGEQIFPCCLRRGLEKISVLQPMEESAVTELWTMGCPKWSRFILKDSIDWRDSKVEQRQRVTVEELQWQSVMSWPLTAAPPLHPLVLLWRVMGRSLGLQSDVEPVKKKVRYYFSLSVISHYWNLF